MIDLTTTYLCAGVLIVAGFLEVVTNPSPQIPKYAGFLCALGFFMLGARYFYLAGTGDIGRLNVYGTGAIGVIALGRIIACAGRLRR